MSKEEDIHELAGAKTSGHKPNYDLLTPEFLKRTAARMTLGMHYGRNNWKKGIASKEYVLDRLNHAFEHLTKAMAEIGDDVPMTDDDLAAVVVNCMFAMEYHKDTSILIAWKAIGEEVEKIREQTKQCRNCGAQFTHAPWKMKCESGILTGDYYFHSENCLSIYHKSHPELKLISITYPTGMVATPLDRQ